MEDAVVWLVIGIEAVAAAAKGSGMGGGAGNLDKQQIDGPFSLSSSRISYRAKTSNAPKLQEHRVGFYRI
jgi:hypothetical protein